MGARDYNYQADKLTEMLELTDELDSCDEHMRIAYKNATDLSLCEGERKEYWGYFWDYLEQSLDIFSSVREMPVRALLGYIEIVEHDKDSIKYPKNDDEFYLYGNLDARQYQIRQIIEMSR